MSGKWTRWMDYPPIKGNTRINSIFHQGAAMMRFSPILTAISLSALLVAPATRAAPFASCDEARAAGAAPLLLGQPGYSGSLDRDGDGVACELLGNDSIPPAGSPLVGTLIDVVIYKSFVQTNDKDECVGTGTLATVRRGSVVILSAGSFSADTRTVAIADFRFSRMHDGKCEAFYRTDAPRMPAFNFQFVGPDGQRSASYGPVKSQDVVDPRLAPEIQQAVKLDMESAL